MAKKILPTVLAVAAAISPTTLVEGLIGETETQPVYEKTLCEKKEKSIFPPRNTNGTIKAPVTK